MSADTTLNFTATRTNSVIGFATTSRGVAESVGSLTLTVTRTGDLSKAASFVYTTPEDAVYTRCEVVRSEASHRCDFVGGSGTLEFAANQSTRTFPIFITDDTYSETAEVFRVTLAGVGTTETGTDSVITVTINDNDLAPPPGTTPVNPILIVDSFVRQQYIDFLGREPEAGGFADWQRTLNNCRAGDQTCDRVQVSSAFFRSEEFQQRGYFVYRAYATLGRAPRYTEFMADLSRLSGPQTPVEQEANKVAFLAEFMARTEYRSVYGGSLTAAQYVDLLAQKLGVTLATRDQLVSDLQTNAKTEAQVVRAAIDSGEVVAKYYNPAFVSMEYFGYLRRDPEPAGYQDWINHINRTGSYRELVDGFVNSTEYRLRFGL